MWFRWFCRCVVGVVFFQFHLSFFLLDVGAIGFFIVVEAVDRFSNVPAKGLLVRGSSLSQ